MENATGFSGFLYSGSISCIVSNTVEYNGQSNLSTVFCQDTYLTQGERKLCERTVDETP